MISERASVLIQKFLDRILSPEEREELDRMLVEDPAVAAAFAEATRYASFLETSLREVSSRGVESDTPRRMTGRRRFRGVGSSSTPMRILVAASVLMGAFVVVLTASLTDEKPTVARKLPEPVPVVRPKPSIPKPAPAPEPVKREEPRVVRAVPPRSKPAPSPGAARPSPPRPRVAPVVRKPAPAPVPPPERPKAPPPTPPTAVAVAVVKEVSGIARVGQADARPGAAVVAGQQLSTGEGSLRIVFEDGTEVRLASETELRVPGQDSGKKLNLVRGSIESRIARQPRNRPMVFETPQARAIVLGTTLRLGLEGGDLSFTRLAVTEGKVRLVRSVDGKSVDVAAGHYALAGAERGRDPRAYPFAVLLQTVSHGRVRTVGVTPDGRSVASGGGDGAVKMWSAATGREVVSIPSHLRDVTCVDFAPRGDRVASGSYDDTVRIWDLRGGKSAAQITTIPVSFEAVRFSPDGRTLATGTRDGVVRLWDGATGRFKDMLTGHAGGAEALSFSPDGRLLASGGRDRMARIWDLGTRRERAALAGHSGNVNAVAFAPDGKTLYTGSGDGTIRRWAVATGKETARYRSPGGSGVLALAFGPEGRRFISAGADGRVRIWDVELECVAETLSGHAGQVVDAAFSRDGKLIVSGGTDDRVRVWRVR